MKRHKKFLGKLYIVEPTLESLIKECPNPKACAENAGKEYSNFLKSCRLAKNFELMNFVQTAGALERDTILLTLPRGYVEQHIKSPPRVNHWYLVTTQKETLEMLCEFFESQNKESLDLFLCRVSLNSLKALRNQLESIINEAKKYEGD